MANGDSTIAGIALAAKEDTDRSPYDIAAAEHDSMFAFGVNPEMFQQ